MDNPVIAKKIESLVHCLKRIEEKRPQKLQDLQNDFDLQDIISVNLERAVQLSVDISAVIIAEQGLKTGSTMAECFSGLEKAGIIDSGLSAKLQKAVGFRNISVHEYTEIDWKIVFDIIHHHLENFRKFLKAII